jgi:hypothetical protein
MPPDPPGEALQFLTGLVTSFFPNQIFVSIAFAPAPRLRGLFTGKIPAEQQTKT